ncbi:hypothetical protein L1887_02799 [Cichorium endivia]|nr:hypothetical protein L1887_02799 [Cichorium endivia]
MQNWFSGGGGGDSSGDNNHNSLPTTLSSSSSSLLADWNSYASTKGPDAGSSSLVGSFDIESAVRSANDTMGGAFNVVSRGVSNIPGNLQSATSNIPSGKSLMYFGLLLASGVFFIFMAFTVFLPVIVIVPQKFALCFTVGCGFIIGAFFMLKGPKTQFLHMTSTERLPFTLGFIGSMVGTIYVSMVLHSYILSVFFAVIQVLALAYYCISYFPGGSAGMKFLTSSLTSAVLKCFGR